VQTSVYSDRRLRSRLQEPGLSPRLDMQPVVPGLGYRRRVSADLLVETRLAPELAAALRAVG